jgi:pimeloyl-ACP methyl ester carboxylesterase
MLHGAGSRGENALKPLLHLADEVGLILVALDSRGRTWDLILDDYGPDVALIDRALAGTFAQYNIEPRRVALAGFSDGASYALSLGLTNGDLFDSLIAFSPGFMKPAARRNAPGFFISHEQRTRLCRSIRPVGGWCLNSSATVTRCATGNSPAATPSRPRSRAKRSSGLCTEVVLHPRSLSHDAYSKAGYSDGPGC